MLNGTYTNYYQPQQQTQNYYQPNTSNMYSNPFIASAMQPLPIFNQQQYAPMQQQSFVPQNYNYQPAQQQSSISPMLMNILSILMQFLPMLLGRNSQQLNPVPTTPVYATPAPGTDEVLPNPVAAPVVTLTVADQPVSATQTKGEVFKEVMLDMVGLTGIKDEQAAQDAKIAQNEAKDIVQETAIAANTTAIAANDAKDAAQETKITNLEAQIAELKAALAANTAKDATQDTQIAAGVTKDGQQDSKIAAVETKNATQDTQIAAGVTKDGQQDSKIAAVEAKNTTQDGQIAAVVAVNNTQNTTITNNFNLINTRWTNSFGFDLNGNTINRDPLVLDINKDGKISTESEKGVDLNNDGLAEGAAVDGDKMLAMSDQNANGKIDAAEVFGTDTINPFTKQKVNARNGFEALKEIAASAKEATGIEVSTNGVVNLSKLQEALAKADTQLGLIGDNNVTELEGLGEVEAIDSNYTETPTEGMNLQTSSFITKSGEKFETRDVWFTEKK
ncbi:MAG: hypothetical protein A2039_02285 [Candidatus Melainabacteria bacterium GWA2_34_9]|nr:MAG: hypothetical protein A2039_02285 [Candidatus Melainabacteria bacterium GWA2_34_9]